MQQPVLVRELSDVTDNLEGLRRIGADLNADFTKAKSPVESAISAGKNLSVAVSGSMLLGRSSGSPPFAERGMRLEDLESHLLCRDCRRRQARLEAVPRLPKQAFVGGGDDLTLRRW